MLAASILHDGETTVGDLKAQLAAAPPINERSPGRGLPEVKRDGARLRLNGREVDQFGEISEQAVALVQNIVGRLPVRIASIKFKVDRFNL